MIHGSPARMGPEVITLFVSRRTHGWEDVVWATSPTWVLAFWEAIHDGSTICKQVDLESRQPSLEAERRRTRASQVWKSDGRRLTGLNELLCHLDEVAQDLARQNPESCRILASLVHRLTRDFETALEGGLSGYLSVASDAMRDVMEGTDLILLFSTDISLVESWADTPIERLGHDFSPSRVRRILRRAGLKYVSTNSAAEQDYRAHSRAIHISPRTAPLVRRGLASDGPFINDAALSGNLPSRSRTSPRAR